METNKIYRVVSYVIDIEGSFKIEYETTDKQEALDKAKTIVTEPYEVVGEQLVVEVQEVRFDFEVDIEEIEIIETFYNETPLPKEDDVVIATISWHIHPNYAIDIHELEFIKNTNYKYYSELKGDPDLSFRPFNIILSLNDLLEYYRLKKENKWKEAPYPLDKVHTGFFVVQEFLNEHGFIQGSEMIEYDDEFEINFL
jgi:hypothetical protein